MNSYGMQNLYQPIEVIRNFRFMTADALFALREQYSLKMGNGELTFCQNYYKSRESRDPLVSELILLDRIIVGSEKLPSSVMLSGISSDDPILGEIFDDMQKKLAASGKKPPYSFCDIANCADIYLKKAGKKTASPGIYGKCARLGALEFTAKGAKPLVTLTENTYSSCTLGIPVAPPYSHEPSKESDSFIVLSKSDPDTDSGDFLVSLSALLRDPEVNRTVKSITTLENGNALSFLLGSAKGFYADITSFPGYENDPSPSLLVSEIPDAVIALADGKGVMNISKLAGEKDIRFAAFARPLTAPKISVRYMNGYPLSMNADFLRSIRFTAQLSAISGAMPCGSIKASSADHTENIIYCSSSCSGGSLYEAADTVICAIAPLIAKGVSYENISVSFDARLPILGFDKEIAYSALSMLLGKYRVQAELCLLSEGSRYTASANELSHSVYARAKKPEADIQTTAFGTSGKLFLIAPRRTACGLVDFAELRKIFRYVSELVKSGAARSVRAVGPEGIDSALIEMTDGAKLSDYSLPDELIKYPIGAFIIESKEDIPGLAVNYEKLQ